MDTLCYVHYLRSSWRPFYNTQQSRCGLQNNKIPNDPNTYYYWPFAFVDYEVLNDRITTTEGTVCGRDFRDNVIRQDGPACVVKGAEKDNCDTPDSP